MNDAVINWRERYKWIKIKREIAISMYLLFLGIIILGVNSITLNNDAPYGGFVFFIEICFIVVYFIFLLYKNKIKHSLHLFRNSIFTIYHSTTKKLKYRFNQIYPLDRLKNEQKANP